jgi:beta-xylosidase
MSQATAKTNTYRNPILPGFNPDPSLCYVPDGPGKGYYVSTSTFEFFPGLPIYHSSDLVSWKVCVALLMNETVELTFSSSAMPSIDVLKEWICRRSKVPVDYGHLLFDITRADGT